MTTIVAHPMAVRSRQPTSVSWVGCTTSVTGVQYGLNLLEGVTAKSRHRRISGAFLTGLMVLIFLRDWRSALIVVMNIRFALLAAVILLWGTGQTINIMTLGGLALAVGVLVDEATVSIENIHTQMRPGVSRARAVLEA
jgi:multidrug efflux pump subunit AcrB